MLKFASPESYCLAECSRWFKPNPAARHQVHPDSANCCMYPGRAQTSLGWQSQKPPAQNPLCRDQRSDLSRTFPKPFGVFPEPLLQMLQLKCILTLHTSACGFCLGTFLTFTGLAQNASKISLQEEKSEGFGQCCQADLAQGIAQEETSMPSEPVHKAIAMAAHSFLSCLLSQSDCAAPRVRGPRRQPRF